MPENSWCSLDVNDWFVSTPTAWDQLEVCLGTRPEMLYLGAQPARLSPDSPERGFMRDFPIDDLVPAGTTSPNSVQLDTGRFVWAKELYALPSIGGFRWTFGLSYHQGDTTGADSLLGPGFTIPQCDRLEMRPVEYEEDVRADRPIGYFRLEESVGPPSANLVRPAANSVVIPEETNFRGIYYGSFLSRRPGAGLIGDYSMLFLGQSSGSHIGIYTNGTHNTPDRLKFRPRFDEFALEAWVKTPLGGTVLCKGGNSSSQSQFELGVTASGNAYAIVGGHHLASNESDFNDNEWHHLVLVNECTDQGTVCALWVDGVRRKGPEPSGDATNEFDVLVGARRDLSNADYAAAFVGQIDEVAFYDYALPAHRIISHHQKATQEVEADESIVLVTARHTRTPFYKQSNDVYVARGPAGGVIRRHTEGGSTPELSIDRFEYTTREGTKVTFRGFHPGVTEPGTLESIEDRFGNRQSYQWIKLGAGIIRLHSVTDPYGRTVSYAYSGDTPTSNRLRQIADFAGNLISFEYDVRRRLKAVTLPPPKRDGSEFPEGTTYRFEWNSDNTLAKIFYPNSDVRPVYQVAYYPSGHDQYPRVRSETIGDPVLEPSGGVYTYVYETLTPATPLDASNSNSLRPCDVIRRRARMTDPNGNVTVYSFNRHGLLVWHRTEVPDATKKLSLQQGPYDTRTAYNRNNQPILVEHPMGNRVMYDYEDGVIQGISTAEEPYRPRLGLLLQETHIPDVARGAAQPSLTRRYFYEPIFSQLCATQDLGGHVTYLRFDYQEGSQTAVANTFGERLFPGDDASGTKVNGLVSHVNGHLLASGLSGFSLGLGDLNGDGVGTTMAGNVIRVVHPPAGTQMREEAFTYNQRGQVTTRTDPSGVVTAFVRHTSVLGGNTSGPPKQYGWLKTTCVDVSPTQVATIVGTSGDLTAFSRSVPRTVEGPPLDLRTHFDTYDWLGNVTKITDARGFSTSITRSARGEVYQLKPPSPYEDSVVEYKYDANRNVVSVRHANRVIILSNGRFQPARIDGSVANLNTKEGSGGPFIREFAYDLRDNQIVSTEDPRDTNFDRIATNYRYDRNCNLVKVTKPNGDIVEFDYDERNLKIAQRVGHAQNIEPGSVTLYSYDKNGNPVNVIDASDRDGASGTSLSAVVARAFGTVSSLSHTGDWAVENVYDGFDRLVRSADALGNAVEYTLNADGAPASVRHLGHQAGLSPTTRDGLYSILSRTEFEYDGAGRQYLERAISLEDEGNLVTVHEFDADDRVTRSIDPVGAVTQAAYDGAGRVVRQTDPMGNQSENTYDASGNLVGATATEKSTKAGVADEKFSRRWWYDALGRMVAQAEPGADGSLGTDFSDANTRFSFFGHDSRGQLTDVVDPTGNSSHRKYDGAGRLVEVVADLRDGADAIEAVTTKMRHDANGRLIELEHANGGVTEYMYDSLDRLRKTTYPGGFEHVTDYNASGQPLTYTDGNGSVFNSSYDALGRLTGLHASAGGGTVGTVHRTLQYDGLSRLCSAAEDAHAVGFTYDSLGRLRTEQHGSHGAVVYSEFEGDRFTRMAFPGPGSRQLQLQYDALDRLRVVGEADALIGRWDFVGPTRLVESVMGNQITCSFLDDEGKHSAVQAGPEGVPLPAWSDACGDRLGYDAAGRPIAKRYFGTCLGSATAEHLGMVRQVVTDKREGWEFPMAYAGGLADTGTSDRQGLVEQAVFPELIAWGPVHPHAGPPEPPLPPTPQPGSVRPLMIHQITHIDSAGFDYLRARPIPRPGTP